MDTQNDPQSSLFSLILVVSCLFISLIIWLLLSSCLGLSALQAISGVWDATVAGARVGGIQGAINRRRRVLGGLEGEDWEMESRRRLPG